jgi:predicted transcriptional regulator
MPPQETRASPTDAELEIIQAIWKHGPLTVRQVMDYLGRERTHQTTGTLMKIMERKGQILREGTLRPFRYRSVMTRGQVQRERVSELIRLFGGSAKKLIMRVVSSSKATPKELDEIRRMLAEHKSKGG